MMHRPTRRGFIKSAAALPAFGALSVPVTSAASTPDRVLVIVQLSGGNDGLNTVVPYAEPAYYEARPDIGLPGGRLIKLNDELAFNDQLGNMARLFDSGDAAVVLGTGYPEPDRSHFRSMEIWHTASGSGEFIATGWLGRYFNGYLAGAPPHAGIALMGDRPQAFAGSMQIGIAFADPRQLGWRAGKSTDTVERFEALAAATPDAEGSLGLLRDTTLNAVACSREVRGAFKKYPAGRDPLQGVASMMRAGLPTRVYYVSVGGFDTHSSQLGQQDALLGRVDAAIGGFQETLEATGIADRVVLMVFSEFGRRVEQNASGGTDHGTAGPVFVVGKRVRGGFHGAMPSLRDLDNGDLKFTTDFRGVYTALLRDWLGIDPEPVVPGEFEAPALFA